MIIPEVDEDMEKLELSNIASRNGEWHKNIRNGFPVPYKLNFYIYSVIQEFYTQYCPEAMETWPQRDLIQEYLEELYS